MLFSLIFCLNGIHCGHACRLLYAWHEQHKWSLTFCALQGEMGRGMTCLTIGDDQVGAQFHAPDATFDNEGLSLLTKLLKDPLLQC